MTSNFAKNYSHLFNGDSVTLPSFDLQQPISAASPSMLATAEVVSKPTYNTINSSK